MGKCVGDLLGLVDFVDFETKINILIFCGYQPAELPED